MRITFLAPHIKIAGGTRALLTYAHLLAIRGHDVTVVFPVTGAFRRLVGGILMKKPSWFHDFAAKLKRVPPDYNEAHIPDGDILVACGWQTVMATASASKRKGVKFYFIQHDESLYHGASQEVERIWRGPAKDFHNITISTWLQEVLRDKFNTDAELIVTPVDFSLFHYISQARTEGPIRIMLLDHPYRWKGTEAGAKAVAEVRREFPDIKLVLFGAKRTVTDIPHDEYFPNPEQKKLAELYSSCDIFLCPSEYEGLGMPAMEAMACKSAVVTYDTGGSRDYAFDGTTAFVAKHADYDDLVRKLRMAVADRQLRETIAQNGYIFIKTLSWDDAARRMEEIFLQHL